MKDELSGQEQQAFLAGAVAGMSLVDAKESEGQVWGEGRRERAGKALRSLRAVVDALPEEERSALMESLSPIRFPDELPYERSTGEVFEVADGGAVAVDDLRPGIGADFDALIDAMTPKTVPTPALVLQARRNSAARTALIDEFGLLTSHQLAELGGSSARNKAALASRWKREGKIFSVQQSGSAYYPAFQFDNEGRPRAEVAEVLQALDAEDGWDTALWFIADNGYLEGRRPVDLLEESPETVVKAALNEAESVFF